MADPTTYDVKPLNLDQEVHKLPSAEKLLPDVPRGTGQFKRLFDRVFLLLRLLLTDNADYDSGYFKVEVPDSLISYYEMEHNIGSVPRRHVIYYSADRPTNERDYVRVVSPYEIHNQTGQWNMGMTLQHRLDGQRSRLGVRLNRIYFNDETAWVRVMLWR